MSAEQGDVELVRNRLAVSGTVRERAAFDWLAGALINLRHTHANLDFCTQERYRLTAALERAEREREAVRFCPYCATGFTPNPGDEHKDSCPGCARAEKAERALAEAQKALREIIKHERVTWQVGDIARAALRPSEERA